LTVRKIAVVMDPIASIKPHKDSSLAMMLEAQSRGWEVSCVGLSDIWLRDGEAWGNLTQVQVFDDTSRWFAEGDTEAIPLSDLDVILMRKDPPFDMEYIFATYVLERAEDAGTIVVNSPQGLRDANEKAFVAWFPDCVPATLISRSLDEMRAFMAEHQRVVVKPMDLMGGRSVFATDADDGNHNVILETVSDFGARYTMVQEYLPEIKSAGDKRILLIDGQPIEKALVRIPSDGDHRGNMDAGAVTEIQPLTDRDYEICDRVRSVLQAKGLIFTGIDIIGQKMTELNVTSPTGIREIERQGGVPVTQPLFDAIEKRLK
jgi:glutathione synthase